jgi:elongation factor 1-beta
VFKAISTSPDASSTPHIARWYKHIKSYSAEFGSLPGSSKAGEGFLGSSSAPDDDDIDLFGEDEEEDEEAERVKAERVAAYNAKKANKPKAAAKVSLFVFPPYFTLFGIKRQRQLADLILLPVGRNTRSEAMG